MTRPHLLLGIDIGGTKTSVCLGGRDGAIHAARRLPTDPRRGPDDWLARVRHLADQVLAKAGRTLSDVDAVGLSCPGPMSVARGMMLGPCNLPGWDAVPAVDMLRGAFQRPTFINNDANAAALAEYLYGSRRGTPNLVYLTMSTGVGGGVVVDGRLVQGACDMAGEVGHFVLDPAGPPCLCGLRGCFEAFCGGLSVARRLQERIVRERRRTAILDEAGGDPERIDFRAILAAVRRDDPLALEEWDAFVERLAQGIGIVIMTLNPQAIVLGTIAIHAGDRLLGPVRERLPKYAWKTAIEACEIVPSALGEKIADLAALAVARTGVDEDAGRR
jgi:glucokinase